MKLSIIVPVYNEEKTIDKIIKKLENLKLDRVVKEIIIVDDGSTDNSVAKIKKQIGQNKLFKLIVHEKNQGKGAAVRTGIKNSTGEYIIIQDADLEYDPSYISILLEPVLNKKAQVVYGTRLNRLPHLFGEERTFRFLLHYFGNRFLSLLTSFLYGQFLTDMETGYKLFPRRIATTLNLCAKSFDFEPEITAKLAKKGLKITEVPIITQPREYAEGKKLNTLKDGAHALWTLLKYRFVN